MIFHHHHRSFFLPILVLLTVGLVVFMFFSLTDSRKTTESTQQQTITPVSSQEYTSSIKKIGKKFVESYEAAENDIARLVLVESTLSELLALRVPADQKDIHLERAVILSQMQAALKAQDNEKAQKLFETWIQEY